MFLPFNQEQHSGWLKNNQVPDEWKWVESGNIFYCETRNQHYALAPSVTSITGCWDFAMLGSEATVIDHFYRTQAANSIDGGLFDVDLKIAREDIMLIDGNCIARLQYENNSKSHLHFDYFLNKLVFRKQELNRFIQSLQEESADPLQDKRVLGSKERNTLFNLIKALCNELSIDPFSRGAATPLQEITELAGIPLSNETIRQIISRMK
ncbi:hypothetical protein EAY27_21345, partial [Vibrio anguillarum]|nr:hypothetical protein [Vibrio anguillarum]